jgi:two-component system response regulator DegU
MVSAKSSIKVMVVDNRADFRQLIAEILEKSGLQICECEDGDQVLDLYEREAPDWVIMDVRMARMDGLTATRRLLRRFPKARVIVVSAHQPEAARKAALESGALHFFSKENLSNLRTILSSEN